MAFDPLQEITLTPEQAAEFEAAIANPDARPARPPKDMPAVSYETFLSWGKVPEKPKEEPQP